MKLATPRPSARRILEIANAVEPVQGRIHIEKINEPFLFLYFAMAAVRRNMAPA
jgi:hypothetical protein